MRDRLHHLRKLLSDDGSIWVHLDDVENHRMRMLLDEVFGSGNFVAEVAWEKADSGRNDTKGFSADHDVIIVYGKSRDVALNRMARTAADNARFSNPDGDVKGVWFSDNRSAPGAATHLGMVYGVQHPITGEMFFPARGACWRLGYDRMVAALQQYGDYEEVSPDLELRTEKSGISAELFEGQTGDLKIKGGITEDSIRVARERIDAGNWPEFFVTETSFGRKAYPPRYGQPPRTWWDNESVGHNREAKSENKALFPNTNAFATPKPERLLERVIHSATNPGDIVLDVFAGSGTTAAVAQKMGRRWVTCELIEDTFTTFTRPRLEKVVRGEDMGGISVTKGERVDASENGLPEGVSADDAQKLVSLLNKVIKDKPELKKSADLRAVKELVKTKKTPEVINWRGGGGFTVATLSKPCFDVDPDTGITMLTEHANAANLTRAVAAHLRFRLTPNDPVFPAKRGSMNLCVTRQPVTQEFIDEILRHVPEGESVTLAATSVSPDMGEYLHKHNEGSRVITVPDGLFVTTLSDKS